MFKWLKDWFKPYEGSSEEFIKLYREVRAEFKLLKPDLVFTGDRIGRMIELMETNGDARLVRGLQDQQSFELDLVRYRLDAAVHKAKRR